MKLAAFPPTRVRQEKDIMSTGGPGSTAGQQEKERKAGDTDPGGKKERGGKSWKEKSGEQDDIDMATMIRAKGIAEGKESLELNPVSH